MKTNDKLNKVSAILGGVLYLVLFLLDTVPGMLEHKFSLEFMLDYFLRVDNFLYLLPFLLFAVFLLIRKPKLIIIPSAIFFLYFLNIWLQIFRFDFLSEASNLLASFALLVFSIFPFIKTKGSGFKPVYICFIPALIFLVTPCIILYQHFTLTHYNFWLGLGGFILFWIINTIATVCLGIFLTTSSEEPEEPATPYSSRYTPSYTPSATPVTPTTPTTGYTPVPPATPASYQPTPPVSSQPAVSGYVYTKPENFSLTEELSKAKALFDKGSINEQEYMQLKNQILNS